MNYIKKTIGWADWSYNAIKGLCPVQCPYCYARKIYNRFRLNPTIRFDEVELNTILKHRKPITIFVGSTIEMYHPDIPREWVQRIIDISKQTPQHTFMTLTKRPAGLAQFNFPLNWELGITITNQEDWNKRQDFIWDWGIGWKIFNKLFVSFEPLLGKIEFDEMGLEVVDKVIIGARTNPLQLPPKEWVDIIIQQAKEDECKIILKKSITRG